jgi:hypothetical protein
LKKTSDIGNPDAEPITESMPHRGHTAVSDFSYVESEEWIDDRSGLKAVETAAGDTAFEFMSVRSAMIMSDLKLSEIHRRTRTMRNCSDYHSVSSSGAIRSAQWISR